MFGTQRSAFGMGDDGDFSDYDNGISDSNVDSLVHHLKSTFGFNGYDNIGSRLAARPDPLRSDGAEAPRTGIARADAEEPSQSSAARVMRADVWSILA